MEEDHNAEVDYKEMVRDGYERCAELYSAERERDDSDQLNPLLQRLAPGSNVLDLGCGAGVPIARRIEHLHRVTGIDASEKMLSLARKAVPGALFLRGDILELDFQPDTFDAVVAIFVLFHLPKEELRAVFARVWSWLRPGGYFLATLSDESKGPYTDDNFFGTQMYWSKLEYNEYEELLQELCFEVIQGRIIGRGYGRVKVLHDERNPMVLARKPV